MLKKALLTALLAATALAGCAATAQQRSAVALAPEVRTGPAKGRAPARVLLATPSCGSLERPCPDEVVATVREVVAGGLDALGYSVVPSDRLVLAARHRTETREVTTQEIRAATSTRRALRVELVGSIFEDLPPAEQRTLMIDAGADAVVTTRVIIGAPDEGWSAARDVEVVVRLGVSEADTLAWTVRCRAPGNDLVTTQRAVEHAARCAIGAVQTVR